MPSLDESRAALESTFITGWGATTKVSFDNSEFDDEDEYAYVDIRFTPYSSVNNTIGSTMHKSIHHSGSFAVVIYTKLDIGAGTAWKYADQVKDIMDNKYHAQNLYTTASETRRNGADTSGWFSLIVSTPFEADEF